MIISAILCKVAAFLIKPDEISCIGTQSRVHRIYPHGCADFSVIHEKSLAYKSKKTAINQIGFMRLISLYPSDLQSVYSTSVISDQNIALCDEKFLCVKDLCVVKVDDFGRLILGLKSKQSCLPFQIE